MLKQQISPVIGTTLIIGVILLIVIAFWAVWLHRPAEDDVVPASAGTESWSPKVLGSGPSPPQSGVSSQSVDSWSPKSLGNTPQYPQYPSGQ